MKYAVLVCFAIFAITSCKKDTTDNPCLETKFEAVKAMPGAVSIQKQKVDGEWHYWLNDGTLEANGYEAIINSSCEEVCNMCGVCRPPACYSLYDPNKWQVVWEK